MSKKKQKSDLSEEEKDAIIDLLLDDNPDDETMMTVNRYLWEDGGPGPVPGG